MVKKRVHPLNAWTCAPKEHKPIAQGIALGGYWVFTCALLRAKAQNRRLLHLQGAQLCRYDSQGDAWGYVLAGLCLSASRRRPLVQPFQPFYISSMHLTDEPKKGTVEKGGRVGLVWHSPHPRCLAPFHATRSRHGYRGGHGEAGGEDRGWL